jgi:hypothetical protein
MSWVKRRTDLLKKGKTTFNPAREYSSGYEVTVFKLESEDMKFVLKDIFNTLKKILPPGTPYEIRARAQGLYGRQKVVVWIYSPGMSKETLFNNHEWKFDQEHAYFILGRFLA